MICRDCGRPKLLDAYCCAGGASVGYERAGFCVTGVDHVAYPDYPFHFIEADAVAFIEEHGHEYAAIHTSPPCQAASGPTLGTNAARNAAEGREHPQLIPATRAALEATGRPYVIENVVSAPVRADLLLCGLMFDLRVYRHRKFELGGWSMPHRTCRPGIEHRGHRVRGWRHGVYHEGDMLAVYGDGGGKATAEECREGLGIDWTWDRKALVEAIPPAYAQHIGTALLAHVQQIIEREEAA
jgi:hypothetical protein